jgi:CheY-like chemotaxis protein
LFETIRKNVELEARLIDDLLDLTSITRGKLALNRRPVGIEEILADAVSNVKPDLDAKEIAFTAENRAGQARVFADAIRLQQAFWNVIKNAAKFTPARGRISVVTTRDDDNETVRIAITDTGIGMNSAELGRVFKAFTQGDHASASNGHRFGGLGLGLAISRSVVELHGGTITAESAGTNQGATFLITLPLFVADESATPALLPAEGPSTTVVPPAGDFHPRILLVEDHTPTRLAIESLLRRRAHEVVAAGSLEAARKAADAGAFQLLISDIGLPDGSGYDLLKELRRRGPIVGIAVTGYGMESDIAESMRAGFSIHLTKPIKIAALEAALHEALRPKTR